MRKKRLARVTHAIDVSRGRWQMVTLTMRHRAGQPLRWLLGGLMKAWRRAKQGGRLQRLWSERVTASVRVTEVVLGERHGWHPHLHVLLRTEEWSDDERAELARRWHDAVSQELPGCEPDDEHGVRWSTPIDVCSATDADRASYIAKLGLEVAGPKDSRRGITHWEVLRRATRGEAGFPERWAEYATATRGRRMLELDDRAAIFARTPLDLDPLEHDVASEIQRVTVDVDTLELRALREYEKRHDPSILGAIVASLKTCERPSETVAAWLRVVTRALYGAKPARPPPARAGPWTAVFPSFPP
jgi:hypothetical protein